MKYKNQKKKSGFVKWILLLVIVIGIGLTYQYRDELLAIAEEPTNVVEAQPVVVKVQKDEMAHVTSSPEYQAWIAWKKEVIFYEEKRQATEAKYQQDMADIEANLDRLREVEMHLSQSGL